jgi:hypothetical protein
MRWLRRRKFIYRLKTVDVEFTNVMPGKYSE